MRFLVTFLFFALSTLGFAFDSDEIRIGKSTYQKIKLLGSGEFGSVYLCRDVALNKNAVVKVFSEQKNKPYIHPQQLRSYRFVQSLQSPKLKRLFPLVYEVDDFHSELGKPVVAMEYVEGLNLGSLQPSPDEFVHIFNEGLRLIGTAAKSGVILGDVHLENFTWNRKTETLKFHDLDTAAPEIEKVPSEMMAGGGAPEYGVGLPTRVSDFYSFAAEVLIPLIEVAEKKALRDGVWTHQMFYDVEMFIDAAIEENPQTRRKNIARWTKQFGHLGSRYEFMRDFSKPGKFRFLMNFSKKAVSGCMGILFSMMP